MTRHLRPRLLEFNRRIRESARRLGVIVVDTEAPRDRGRPRKARGAATGSTPPR